ncbi:MAG: lysophospholipid acyltransferase family protein [Verrucomicrobia bacterium]|nr:lysophospholipid acyltransferase family protein [Verrucomicrobiota bacterium]MCG2679416.1 lysophospholipid acyltransferase family protein [Kiritimatiellia bacterium]MBU4247598.1 lysophospholipid acyltransferase family protein [Verrucomicrobiota bacterium]MBU4289855.1 lysophospholipid acyltransferase family protein [Verrucomicrobiota bacterium]MBU4428775.1 lysophospholipid acyltransferase family protein [Verrucomicrobiota bacterium]
MSEANKSSAAKPPAGKLFDLKKSATHPLHRGLMALLASPLENNLMLSRINEVYAKIARDPAQTHFFTKCLEHFNIRYAISEADLRKIPAHGPLVTVGNHPFGGLEGIVLGGIMARVRPDVKILGNYLLQRLVEIRDQVIPVDVFGNPKARLTNARALKEAIQWVEKGGALVTFPAGEVSHLQWSQGEVTDSSWTPHIGGIIRHARSMVLPVYFPGKNSLFFQVMGLLHPLLRTALLPRELTNKSTQTIDVYVGKPIPWKTLAEFGSDEEIIRNLRANTYFLQNRAQRTRQRFSFIGARQTAQEPIIPAVPANQLLTDIRRLPAEDRLVETEDFSVFIAPVERIPNILREIGRLRETTFRDVREGTGKALDLDEFDPHYLHLFLWNNPAAELAGAYRLGLTDVILKQFGKKGLYTSTLFHFKTGFLTQLENAIELGRSFIVSKYQKEYSCLSLLWKGVGQFIIRHPRHKILFGPVSISNDYHIISKRLIVQFLRQNKLDEELSRYVRPRVPYRFGRVKTADVRSLRSHLRDIDDVSLLISEIEKDGKGIPILLRHYLRLNASFSCFNVDRKFSNVVDGLMRVDLTKTDPRLMRRFMGDEGFQAFARYQGMVLEHDPRDPLRTGAPLLETITAEKGNP